ncbi:Hypothetical predicted protein [Cloeon dipterum]|uniref:Uncharacterized protein n=1 Tax=Cloeon dipterum TaxID=197152 RepID=A0A8S1BTN9_9INSE|nr:Hypothetical predicted protein [Cloeon dipterum]
MCHPHRSIINKASETINRAHFSRRPDEPCLYNYTGLSIMEVDMQDLEPTTAALVKPKKKQYVRSTPEQRQEAINMIQQGETFTAAGKSVGFCARAVSSWYYQHLRNVRSEKRAVKAAAKAMDPSEDSDDSDDEKKEDETDEELPRYKYSKATDLENEHLKKIVYHNSELSLIEAMKHAEYPCGVGAAKKMLRKNGIHYHVNQCMYSKDEQIYHSQSGIKMFKCQPMHFYDQMY